MYHLIVKMRLISIKHNFLVEDILDGDQGDTYVVVQETVKNVHCTILVVSILLTFLLIGNTSFCL